MLSHQPYQNSMALSCHVIRVRIYIYVRIVCDIYCWSIIRFANALIQVTAALPSWYILLTYLLIVVTNKKEPNSRSSEELIEE